MKRLIILFVLVLCLCGCSKEVPDQPMPTETLTTAPTETPTTAPTEKPTEPPTSTPTEAPTPTETEISEDGFVSAEDYKTNDKDWEVYYYLYQWLEIAGCNESITKEEMASLDFTVKIDQDGISFKNIPDSYANALMGFIGDDLDYYRTSQDYYITVKNDRDWFKITMDKAPKH